MPELPEVETVKNGLNKLIIGLKVESVDFDWSKSFPNSPSDVNNFLINAKILGVRRRAKVLIIDLDSKYSLVIHLKMTGQLVFRSSVADFGAGHPNDSLIGNLPDRSTRVTIKFATKKESLLFFNDQRKFGWVKLIPTIEIPNLDFFKSLGPEPLEDNLSVNKIVANIRRRKNSMIKPVIMDQKVIAGVGNIYADESLWGAKIHPETRVTSLSDQQLSKLFQEIKYVLRLSIEKGGSTDKNYVDAEGKKGSYLLFASVFRRENLPCPRCSNIILKIRVAGRGTHFCPVCQIIK